MSLLSFLLQNWNAYIGKLGRKDFCFNVSKSVKSGVQLQDLLNLTSILDEQTVGVIVNFTLDKAVLTPAGDATENTILHGTFTGNDFTTQIKGRCTCNHHIHVNCWYNDIIIMKIGYYCVYIYMYLHANVV